MYEFLSNPPDFLINFLTIVTPICAVLWKYHGSLMRKFDKIDARFEKIDARFEKIDARFEKIDARFDSLEEKLTRKIDRLDEKVTDIDRRVCRIEGALSSKDCCMLKDPRINEKAE